MYPDRIWVTQVTQTGVLGVIAYNAAPAFTFANDGWSRARQR